MRGATMVFVSAYYWPNPHKRSPSKLGWVARVLIRLTERKKIPVDFLAEYRFTPFIKCPATFLTAKLVRANYWAKIDQILHPALFYEYIWVYGTSTSTNTSTGPVYGTVF